MVIKGYNIETPLATEASIEEICQELPLRCYKTNDPCEAVIAVMKGHDAILTNNSDVINVVNVLKSMISIGRAMQVVDSVCRATAYGIKLLKELEVECPDYSYPRALFVIDELSPSIHFLREALKRSKAVEGNEEIEVQCGFRVPAELKFSYPFSQLECPRYTIERIRKSAENHM